MCGQFQLGNIITAAEAARVLADRAFMINDENIENGIKSFFIPGRLECIKENPLIILDAGHNEGAMKELSQALKSENKSIVALCAFMKDKDYSSSLEAIAPCCDKMFFTKIDELRGEDACILAKKASLYCTKTELEPDADSAFKKALAATNKDGVLVVCGSFYLVSHIRKNYFSP